MWLMYVCKCMIRTSGAHGEPQPPCLPQPSWWRSVPCVIVQPSDDPHSGAGCEQAVCNGLQGLPHCRPLQVRQTWWECLGIFLDVSACPNHPEKVFNFCEKIAIIVNWMKQHILSAYCELNCTFFILAAYTHVRTYPFCLSREHDHAAST